MNKKQELFGVIFIVLSNYELFQNHVFMVLSKVPFRKIILNKNSVLSYLKFHIIYEIIKHAKSKICIITSMKPLFPSFLGKFY